MVHRLQITALLLIALLPVAGAQETLGEVLSRHRIEVAGLPVRDLVRPITSYDLYSDEELVLLAGYPDDGSGGLPDRVTLWSLDRARGQWTVGELALVTADGRDVGICLGSVLGVDRVGERFLIRTHLSPSATCELILDRELVLRDVLYGWVLARFGDGTLIYQHNQIHFAPVHSVEISLYHPERRSHQLIYPPLPPFQELRADHFDALAAAFAERGRDWCNANNHPCDPSRFDEILVGPVLVSDAEDALAFVIAFDRLLLGEAEPRQLVYLYRAVRSRAVPEYRELELRAPVVGELDGLAELLTGEGLRTIFGDGR